MGKDKGKDEKPVNIEDIHKDDKLLDEVSSLEELAERLRDENK